MIRFTDDEDQRLTKMLKRRRLTMQAFGHAAVMKALNDLELGKRTDTEIAQEARQEQKQQSKEAPKGFGIRDQLYDNREREQRSREREREPERERTATVAPSLAPLGIDGEILALARTVVDSPKPMRAEILRSACRALARGRTQEEAMRLAEDLDSAIKRIDGTPQTTLERVRARIGR
jgi:hypothetical protein